MQGLAAAAAASCAAVKRRILRALHPRCHSLENRRARERSFHLNDDDAITAARIFQKFLIFIVIASFRAAERRRARCARS
jgi:hypothetical protein